MDELTQPTDCRPDGRQSARRLAQATAALLPPLQATSRPQRAILSTRPVRLVMSSSRARSPFSRVARASDYSGSRGHTPCCCCCCCCPSHRRTAEQIPLRPLTRTETHRPAQAWLAPNSAHDAAPSRRAQNQSQLLNQPKVHSRPPRARPSRRSSSSRRMRKRGRGANGVEKV